MSSLYLVYAHPYPDRSRANRLLLDAVRDLPGVEVRSLYAEYPDFAIDVTREQRALVAADVIVWQQPLYWYGPPALLKLWFEKVLGRGFAYGPDGRALQGKRLLWAVTTGGDELAYTEAGMHERPFAEFVPAIEQTARFCGLQWEEPFVVHGSHKVSPATLDAHARGYRARLEALRMSAGNGR